MKSPNCAERWQKAMEELGGGASEAEAPAELLASRIQRRESGTRRASSLLHAFWCWLRTMVSWLRTLSRRPSSLGSLGPYVLSEKIGQGGMGIVYKATHPCGKRAVAIKLMRTERASARDRERFEREARLTSVLRHPNTISVYGFGRTRDGAPYYVMEYADGLDLQTLVKVQGRQAPERVVRVLAELAAALEELHGMGLVHGDVKPANLVLSTEDGRDRVKVLDFGLARSMGSEGKDCWSGDSQEIAGTPLYVSPETLADPSRVDGRSDLYAVGALGYFLLAGVPPFDGRTALEVFAQHLHAAPVPPSKRLGIEVPPELEVLIMSCLEKAPGQRPASAAALREALGTIAESPASCRVVRG